MKIAVLMTSHNRRTKTLQCLKSLFAQEVGGHDLMVDVVLVDAGSTDGTVDAVRDAFPNVLVVQRDADVFWGGGMRIAAREAARFSPDAHLWLNDDVVLDRDALHQLLATHAQHSEAIVVGQLRDEQGRSTYGGIRRGSRPLNFVWLGIHERPTLCDTVNGNVVLVPREVFDVLGPVDGDSFPHAMGDIDYGLRATRAGFRVIQCAGSLGLCERNPVRPLNRKQRLSQRVRHAASIKRLPPRAWWTLCRRHAGAWAIPYFLKPYFDVARRAK